MQREILSLNALHVPNLVAFLGSLYARDGLRVGIFVVSSRLLKISPREYYLLSTVEMKHHVS
jgi:hypothetical protein